MIRMTLFGKIIGVLWLMASGVLLGFMVGGLLTVSVWWLFDVDDLMSQGSPIPSPFLLFGMIVPSFLAVCGAIAAAVISLRWLKQPPPDGVCKSCGYNLYGLTEPRCPECGAPFDENLLNENA